MSETGVPAAAALTAGRIYAEIAGAVNTGVAIANPNSSSVTINFEFTDANGNSAGAGSTTIPANGQISQFLNSPPFNVYTTATFQGTFSFTSNVPVAVVALRGLLNERGEFLMSTLPVIDTTALVPTGTLVIPHFADGGGWTTQVFLVNPTDNPLTGSVQFVGPDGSATSVTIGGQTNTSFAYSVPRRSSQKLVTSGLGSATASGSIRVVPSGAVTPIPLVVFSYRPAGITVTEAGVPVTRGTAFRMYAESSGVLQQPGNIQTGVAVANLSGGAAAVTFDVTDLNGAPIAGNTPVTINLPGSGQTAKFLGDLFPSLPTPFRGALRITTTAINISIVGLRSRYNERGDFLITTTPPWNENSPAITSTLYFPQLADGGGYTTQFILFSGIGGQSLNGVLQFYSQTGQPLNLILSGGSSGTSGTGGTAPGGTGTATGGSATGGSTGGTVLKPTITGITPASGAAGTAVNVTISGTNFVSGGTAVLVSGSDISVSSLTVSSTGTSLTATFTISATAAAGGRNVSVTTAGGTSNAMTFTVKWFGHPEITLPDARMAVCYSSTSLCRRLRHAARRCRWANQPRSRGPGVSLVVHGTMRPAI